MEYLVAFTGGVVSFLSPCVLPIVPAYLSLIGGVSVVDLREGTGTVRARIIRDTSLFIVGFSTVFVLLGLSITAIGSSAFRNQVVLTRISGALVIAMSVFLLLTQMVNSTWIQREKRFHPKLSRFGPFAAPIAGAAFGFGWTPCIGPVLASVLAVASTQGAATRGGLLLGFYSLGLGVPFLVTGVAFGRLTAGFDWMKRHIRAVNLGAALLLGIFGLLLVLGRFTWVTGELRSFLDWIGLSRLVTLG